MNRFPKEQRIRFAELQRRFPNTSEYTLYELIQIEFDKNFDCNKWYCFLCGIVSRADFSQPEKNKKQS
jgi:hypothetical protein